MIANTQIDEIAQTLMALPAEKIAAVKDYVDFLKAQYARNETIDASDEWSDADLREFAAASAEYGEKVAPWNDAPLDSKENSRHERQSE